MTLLVLVEVLQCSWAGKPNSARGEGYLRLTVERSPIYHVNNESESGQLYRFSAVVGGSPMVYFTSSVRTEVPLIQCNL